MPGRGRWYQVLTIGEFSRASRLSAKALRLYDELGLLRPARVDPLSGYRFYAPGQLDRARLVAWLRRLGMPLARIRLVCDAASPAVAAAEVAAFWAQAEADHASRRDLAAFLTRYLEGEEAPMAHADSGLAIRYAAGSDTGRRRAANQDSAYAGARLLAVADGMGGAGHLASAAAIDALKPLETAPPAGDLLNALENAVQQAGAAVADIAAGEPARAGSGTTLTAMLWAGSQLALVHIGDTRAYLLRDGGLYQITHDHTVVQSLIDEGRLTPDEAVSHPQRALLLRALDGGGAAADLSLHDAQAGDRYLLCSDGLTTVVPEDRIQAVLTAAATPDQVVRELIAAANESGGPDNIACAAADIVPAPDPAT